MIHSVKEGSGPKISRKLKATDQMILSFYLNRFNHFGGVRYRQTHIVLLWNVRLRDYLANKCSFIFFYRNRMSVSLYMCVFVGLFVCLLTPLKRLNLSWKNLWWFIILNKVGHHRQVQGSSNQRLLPHLIA